MEAQKLVGTDEVPDQRTFEAFSLWCLFFVVVVENFSRQNVKLQQMNCWSGWSWTHRPPPLLSLFLPSSITDVCLFCSVWMSTWPKLRIGQLCGVGGLCNTRACVISLVADYGSAEKCSKMAPSFSVFFVLHISFLFLFGKKTNSHRLVLEEWRGNSVRPAFFLSSVAVHNKPEWNSEWTYCFMYICEIVQSHESKCTIPKRITSCSTSLLICYANLFSICTSEPFYSVATHNISLFYCLNSIFSYVNIPEDILCQNAKKWLKTACKF